MSFFISPAMAQEAAATGTGGLSSMVFLIIFAMVFYFMMWRPQAKRAKEHRALVASLAKGDEVVTSAGIVGKILKVDDDYVVLSVDETTEMRFQKTHVTAALPKGTIKDI